MTRSSHPRSRLAVGAATATAAIILTLSSSAAAVDEPTEPGELKLIDTPNGKALADRDSYPLYLQDTGKAYINPCVDDCSTNWPAATGYPTKADGVEGDTGFTNEIPEGADKPQVIYNGHLLHYYTGDRPYESKGQGIGGWSLVGADGNALTTRRTATTESPGPVQATPSSVRGSVEYVSGTTQDSEVRPLAIGSALVLTAAAGLGILLRRRQEKGANATRTPDSDEGGQ